MDVRLLGRIVTPNGGRDDRPSRRKIGIAAVVNGHRGGRLSQISCRDSPYFVTELIRIDVRSIKYGALDEIGIASAVTRLLDEPRLAAGIAAAGRAHAELTRKPTPAELSAAAAASRDFPIPGSPLKTTPGMLSVPACACAQDFSSCANSRSRPTSGPWPDLGAGARSLTTR